MTDVNQFVLPALLSVQCLIVFLDGAHLSSRQVAVLSGPPHHRRLINYFGHPFYLDDLLISLPDIGLRILSETQSLL